MHYPGERCPPLLLPGPKFMPELVPPCPPHAPELFSNTCHPLSITKSPLPRWQGCPQGAPAVSLMPCQPLVQKCVLLCPEPCETTRLLPRRELAPRLSSAPQTLPAPRSIRGDKKRVAKSLPPCAPRCPEPGRLRFPPCGLRCSSASCRGECGPRKVARCPSRCPELTSGYSLPLGGVTECPPQQGLAHSFLREYLACGVAPHRCSKGYPTQELVTCYSSEQRLSSASRSEVTAKATKECPPLQEATKGSRPLEVSKGRSGSAQQLSKSRCAHPRAAPRASRLGPAGPKRSGHAKKSRCASKWLW